MQKVHFYCKCTVGRAVLFALMAFMGLTAVAQQIKVSGTVTDETTGDPLYGVTVLEKGTSNGIATDLDGRFTIEVGGVRL